MAFSVLQFPYTPPTSHSSLLNNPLPLSVGPPSIPRSCRKFPLFYFRLSSLQAAAIRSLVSSSLDLIPTLPRPRRRPWPTSHEYRSREISRDGTNVVELLFSLARGYHSYQRYTTRPPKAPSVSHVARMRNRGGGGGGGSDNTVWFSGTRTNPFLLY